MTTVAVVGSGFIGPVHVEALRRLGINLAGILAADAEKTHEAAQRLRLDVEYTSFQQILDDAAVEAFVEHFAELMGTDYRQTKGRQGR